MLPEDEIFMCGMVLLYGILIGAAARVVVALRKERAA
jgi:hypothetical protein